MRAERGAEPLLTLDAGDTIQGTPLAYYYAKIEPITGGAKHPMAAAMNAIGYDAAALGNHEFNYGIDTAAHLRAAAATSRCSAPTRSTRRPARRPSRRTSSRRSRCRGGRPIKVGILGLTNPGIAIWDKANVEGKMRFPGLVEQAKDVRAPS